MTEWAFILTPLLVLPIVLLFRFLGCGLNVVGTAEPTPPPSAQQPPSGQPPTQPPSQPPTTNPPRYRDYIMGEPNNPGTVKNPGVVPDKANVIGYWRLVDGATATVATDENGFQNGQYKSGPALSATMPTATNPGSEAAPGTFTTGQPSLVVSDSAKLCRFFNGGYVQVPFKAGLYTDEFTIEAWLLPNPLRKDYEHVLFCAGGNYAIPPGGVALHGFTIYEDRNGAWQVSLRPAKTALFATPPLVPRPGRTHLAVTVQNDGPGGVKKKVTLYVDAKPAGIASVNSYSRPENAPLLIGVLKPDPLAPKSPSTFPLLGDVQEVVMHRTALSQAEIENHVDINR